MLSPFQSGKFRSLPLFNFFTVFSTGPFPFIAFRNSWLSDFSPLKMMLCVFHMFYVIFLVSGSILFTLANLCYALEHFLL